MKVLMVICGTIVAAIIGVGLAQNMKCKRCGLARKECECPGGPL